MRLKNEEGNILEVNDDSCFPPDKDGSVSAYLGGFSYITGKPTKEPVNSEAIYGGGSLAERWKEIKRTK